MDFFAEVRHAPLVWLASFRGASGLRQCEVACGLLNGALYYSLVRRHRRRNSADSRKPTCAFSASAGRRADLEATLYRKKGIPTICNAGHSSGELFFL